MPAAVCSAHPGQKPGKLAGAYRRTLCRISRQQVGVAWIRLPLQFQGEPEPRKRQEPTTRTRTPPGSCKRVLRLPPRVLRLPPSGTMSLLRAPMQVPTPSGQAVREQAGFSTFSACVAFWQPHMSHMSAAPSVCHVCPPAPDRSPGRAVTSNHEVNPNSMGAGAATRMSSSGNRGSADGLSAEGGAPAGGDRGDADGKGPG
mmetsp:Transcript_40734/g.110140  ORF Transcript_40734/g.110140 Transcript_40734/m.110140 type:complete len:201 (+) Transcript_40734:77-679(+)